VTRRCRPRLLRAARRPISALINVARDGPVRRFCLFTPKTYHVRRPFGPRDTLPPASIPLCQ
jgi:hypothetical protein